MAEENLMEQKHFVLVHGMGHGAWCWYKLKPRLESVGHKVTSIDLTGCGINKKKIEDVETFSEYSEPLLELLASLDSNEKVILVGHSFGGLSIALAMDKFPHKIAVGVFVAAFAPDTLHKPSYVIEKLLVGRDLVTEWKDCKFTPCGGKMLIHAGPKTLSREFYQLCSAEDLELGKSLIKPGSLFIEELSQTENLSKEGYESVRRAYIVCDKDLVIHLDHQQWMIQNAGIGEVVEIKGSDHMAMLSKPQELFSSLLQIVAKHP